MSSSNRNTPLPSPTVATSSSSRDIESGVSAAASALSNPSRGALRTPSPPPSSSSPSPSPPPPPTSPAPTPLVNQPSTSFLSSLFRSSSADAAALAAAQAELQQARLQVEQRKKDADRQKVINEITPVMATEHYYIYKSTDNGPRVQNGYILRPKLRQVFEHNEPITPVGLMFVRPFAVAGNNLYYIRRYYKRQQDANKDKDKEAGLSAMADMLSPRASNAEVMKDLYASDDDPHIASARSVAGEEDDDEDDEDEYETDSEDDSREGSKLVNAGGSSDIDEDDDEETLDDYDDHGSIIPESKPQPHKQQHRSQHKHKKDGKNKSNKGRMAQMFNRHNEPITPARPIVPPPVCCICEACPIQDPWISECGHVCCADCWSTWIQEYRDCKCPDDDCDGYIIAERLKPVSFCVICNQIPRNPYQSPSCGHTACKDCWLHAIKQSSFMMSMLQVLSCPKCGKSVDTDAIKSLK